MAKKKSKNEPTMGATSSTRDVEFSEAMRGAVSTMVNRVPPSAPVLGVAYRIAAAWMVVVFARIAAENAEALARTGLHRADMLFARLPELKDAPGATESVRFGALMRRITSHNEQVRGALEAVRRAREVATQALTSPPEIIKTVEVECSRLREEIAADVRFPVEWQSRVYSALSDLAGATRSGVDQMPGTVESILRDLLALSKARGEGAVSDAVAATKTTYKVDVRKLDGVDRAALKVWIEAAANDCIVSSADCATIVNNRNPKFAATSDRLRKYTMPKLRTLFRPTRRGSRGQALLPGAVMYAKEIIRLAERA